MCFPPLNVEAVLASVGGRSDYLGSAVTRDTGDPWESTRAPLKARGERRLMLVHNSFKHHLEVETWFPVDAKDTHRDDLLFPTEFLAPTGALIVMMC